MAEGGQRFCEIKAFFTDVGEGERPVDDEILAMVAVGENRMMGVVRDLFAVVNERDAVDGEIEQRGGLDEFRRADHVPASVAQIHGDVVVFKIAKEEGALRHLVPHGGPFFNEMGGGHFLEEDIADGG